MRHMLGLFEQLLPLSDAKTMLLIDDDKTQPVELNIRLQQRMGAEVMSQRIREMSDNDPRVVALVIRQWMGNEHE